VELRGVDYVPENERHSKVKELFFVFVGAQMCFGIIVVGTLPIIFGLGFWQAVGAITFGLAVGSAFFGPLAMFGPKTGTNGAVASGAHFGVRGRLIGSVITIIVALFFVSLTVWTGGEALAAGFGKLFGWAQDEDALALGAAVISAAIILVAIFGHATIVATETLVSYTIGAALIITAIALSPQFDPHPGGAYELGAFWPTWFLSAAVCAALPISYATFLNDYSRYVPADVEPRKAVLAAGTGMFVGLWLAFVFAAYVMTLLDSLDTPFVAGLMSVSPTWVVALMILVGFFGSQPQGSLCIYNAALGLQGLGVPIGRVGATIVLSLVSLTMVFAGIYLINMVDIIISFLTLIEAAVSPWLAINIVGYWLIRRGQYSPEDLFAYTVDGAKGRYWYSNGFNPPAVLAWVAGTISGLLFTSTGVFSGPLSGVFGGVSVDYIIAFFVGGALYLMLERDRALAPAVN
jgi:purine-cytosine permease-like protein